MQITKSNPPQGSSPDEQGLISRIQAGEKHLFHELIRPYEKDLYALAYSVVKNPADAEDIVQETVVKAILNLKQLREADRFKGWLFQITMNQAKMKLRHDRQHPTVSLDGEADERDEGLFMPMDVADWREIPSEILERKELRSAIRKAIESLPGSYREILVLRDVQHMSVPETAEVLGISQANVKIRLHRARLQVREQLAPIFRKKWYERLRIARTKK